MNIPDTLPIRERWKTRIRGMTCASPGRPWGQVMGLAWGFVLWLSILTVPAILCASVLHAAPPSTVVPDTAVDYRTASAFFPFIQQDGVGTGGASLLCMSTISGKILPNFIESPATPVPYTPVGVAPPNGTTGNPYNPNYGTYGVPVTTGR